VQLKCAESVYNKKDPKEKLQLADFWIEGITDYYALVSKKFRGNVLAMASEVRAEVKYIKEPYANAMRVYMRSLKN
jgi:hypothetical protein